MTKKSQKTTEIGYINKNNQRNAGKTNMHGTDHGQYFYAMECLNCGHKYFQMVLIYGRGNVQSVKAVQNK